MRIAICVKRDIYGLLAARHLASQLGFADLHFFCSVKTRQAEDDVPALRQMKLLERDVAIDTLAAMEPPTLGLPHPEEWVPLYDMRADGGASVLLDSRPDIVISDERAELLETGGGLKKAAPPPFRLRPTSRSPRGSTRLRSIPGC